MCQPHPGDAGRLLLRSVPKSHVNSEGHSSTQHHVPPLKNSSDRLIDDDVLQRHPSLVRALANIRRQRHPSARYAERPAVVAAASQYLSDDAPTSEMAVHVARTGRRGGIVTLGANRSGTCATASVASTRGSTHDVATLSPSAGMHHNRLTWLRRRPRDAVSLRGRHRKLYAIPVKIANTDAEEKVLYFMNLTRNRRLSSIRIELFETRRLSIVSRLGRRSGALVRRLIHFGSALNREAAAGIAARVEYLSTTASVAHAHCVSDSAKTRSRRRRRLFWRRAPHLFSDTFTQWEVRSDCLCLTNGLSREEEARFERRLELTLIERDGSERITEYLHNYIGKGAYVSASVIA